MQPRRVLRFLGGYAEVLPIVGFMAISLRRMILLVVLAAALVVAAIAAGSSSHHSAAQVSASAPVQ